MTTARTEIDRPHQKDSRRRNAKRAVKEPPSPDRIVEDAIAQVEARALDRGRCSLDRRYAWRLLGEGRSTDRISCMHNLQNEEEWPSLCAQPTTNAAADDDDNNEEADNDGDGDDRDGVSENVSHRRERLIHHHTSQVRSAILNEANSTLRVFEILNKRLSHTGARPILAGTTAVRCALAKRGCSDEDLARACPVDTDVDIDVRTRTSRAHVEVCKRLNAACADILSDASLLGVVTSATEQLGFRTERSKTRSCLYVKIRGVPRGPGVAERVLRVDVPSFDRSSPRLRFGALHFTKNDTLENGVVLYRLRLCGHVGSENGDGETIRVNVPLVDIKAYVSEEAPVTAQMVSLPVGRGLVCAPTDRHLCIELSKLLTRYYDNVDSDKDERRRLQLTLLERAIRHDRVLLRSDSGKGGALASINVLSPSASNKNRQGREQTAE